MLEVKQDLVELLGTACSICITTNLYVSSKGKAVMGRGVAKAMADNVPHLQRIYGNMLLGLKQRSMVKNICHKGMTELIAFPVKPRSEICLDNKSNVVAHMQHSFKPGDSVPGWAVKAKLNVIENSAQQLSDYIDLHRKWGCVNNFYLPRPGCGAGELTWDQVKPIIKKYLDDKVIVVYL